MIHPSDDERRRRALQPITHATERGNLSTAEIRNLIVGRTLYTRPVFGTTRGTEVGYWYFDRNGQYFRHRPHFGNYLWGNYRVEQDRLCYEDGPGTRCEAVWELRGGHLLAPPGARAGEGMFIASSAPGDVDNMVAAARAWERDELPGIRRQTEQINSVFRRFGDMVEADRQYSADCAAAGGFVEYNQCWRRVP